MKRYIYKISRYWALVLVVDNKNIYTIPSIVLHSCDGCDGVQFRILGFNFSLTRFKFEFD